MDQRGVLMCLDLATCLGMSIGIPGETPHAFAHRVAPPEADVGRFLASYSDWLADRITEHAPTVLVFEAPIIWSGKTALATARKLIGLAGITEMVCWRRELKCYEANGATVTKFFTGRASYPGKDAAERRRKKKAAVMARCAELGWEAKTDDEADSLAIFAWSEHRLYPGTREITPLFVRSAA